MRKVNGGAEKGSQSCRGAADIRREERWEASIVIIKGRGGRRTAGCLAVGVDHPSAKCRAKRRRHREGECKLIS